MFTGKVTGILTHGLKMGRGSNHFFGFPCQPKLKRMAARNGKCLQIPEAFAPAAFLGACSMD